MATPRPDKWDPFGGPKPTPPVPTGKCNKCKRTVSELALYWMSDSTHHCITCIRQGKPWTYPSPIGWK
jgi:hypothetical protein